MTDASPLLQVFAREPIPGQVKTRLAQSIGADAAAVAYRDLTLLTLHHARHAVEAGVIVGIELWCTPDEDSAWFRDCAQVAEATRYRQMGAELGSRMAHALADGLRRAPRVLLAGTDCPMLDVTALVAASELLGKHDAVLGPAEDGGFVLVGTRVGLHFDGVRMSTPDTLQDTHAAFGRAGIHCGMLPVSWDVDDAASYTRWKRLPPSMRTTPA